MDKLIIADPVRAAILAADDDRCRQARINAPRCGCRRCQDCVTLELEKRYWARNYRPVPGLETRTGRWNRIRFLLEAGAFEADTAIA